VFSGTLGGPGFFLLKEGRHGTVKITPGSGNPRFPPKKGNSYKERLQGLKRGNVKFEKLVKGFTRPSVRDECIIRIHLLPAFKGQKIWDMDIQGFLDSLATKQSQSSINKICATLRKLKLDVPVGKSELVPKEFGANQILSDIQIKNVIGIHVPAKYRDICWLAVFSCLRLNDVVNLKKSQVQFDGEKPGINLVPGKTRKKNPRMLHIPMNKPLLNVFSRIKDHPSGNDDLWFPNITTSQVKQAVTRAFDKAGIPWGSFIQFRHFSACFLLDQGVSLEKLQVILHHKRIRTTQIYARVKDEAIVEALEKFENFAGGSVVPDDNTKKTAI